jgi:hypothetical protein
MVGATCDVDLLDVDPFAGITVDAEFASLIPPLSVDELRELEASLLEHGGARDPLIVWDRGDGSHPVLLDGHNRLAICRRLGLPFTAKGLRFADRDQAAKWMERNQLGRRNLSRNDFMLLLGRLYNRTKDPSGGHGRKNHAYAGRKSRRTADQLAEEYGVDEKTVRRAGKFEQAAEKLGVAREIASGRLKVEASKLVAAAKSLPDNPTREQALDAIGKALAADGRSKPRDQGRVSQSWLLPADPADCLKAIRFYAKSFVMRCPESIDALNDLLRRLIQENTERVD